MRIELDLPRLARDLTGRAVPRGWWNRTLARLEGKRDGVRVSLVLTTREDTIERCTVAWTELEAELPAGYPLSLDVRDRGPRGDLRSRRVLADIELADRSFGERFVIEGAPADVVRTLLDGDARRFLASHQAAELTTFRRRTRPLLRLSRRGWYEENPHALDALDAVVRIASRVRGAYQTEGPLEYRDDGAPFRPIVDDDAARARFRASEREVAQLDRRRWRRDLLGR